jgi:hypothetical protein
LCEKLNPQAGAKSEIERGCQPARITRREEHEFLSILKTVEHHVSQEEMAKMGKLVEEGLKAGYLLGTEGCLPSAQGARVRRTGEKWS